MREMLPCKLCGRPTYSKYGFCSQSVKCEAQRTIAWARANRDTPKDQARRDSLRERNAAARAYWTAKFNDIKVASGCVVCGFKNSRAGYFALDHVDRTTKNGEITKRFTGMTPGDPKAEAWFVQEVAKCQVLCVACHREKTAGELTNPGMALLK